VSSILKALKKLEQETASNTGARSPAYAEKRRPHRKKNILVPGLIVLSACILIGVGIGLFAQKTIAPQPPTENLTSEQSAATVKIQKPNAPRHKLPGPELPGPEPPGPEFSEPEFPAMSPPEQEAITAPAPEFEFATPRAVLADNRPGSQPEAPENDFLVQSDISVSKPPPGSDDNLAARQPVAQKSQAPVEILEDPAIELQAISWSADSEKRMAIINGKICREKEHVAGYVIDAINSEDVIVSKGSVSGKLVFKIR